MKPEIKNKIIEIIKSNNIRGTNTFGNWYRLCVVTYQDEVIQEPMSRGTRLKNAIRKILGRDTIQPSYQTKKVESTPIRCEYELVSKKDNIIQIIIIENILKDTPVSVEEQYEKACARAAEVYEQTFSSYNVVRSTPSQKEFTLTSNMTKEEFEENVKKAKEHIVNGDIFQIVLSQRFEIDNPPDSFSVYRMLRATNPSPYLFYFKNPDYCIAGASPEMLINVTDSVITTKPIAGTMPRGTTDEEDIRFEKQLLSNEKELAEHTMLVDLGRNDIGKVSEYGSVKVSNLMHIERYSKVMHIVSDVSGKLSKDKNAIDALLSVLPAGTLSGAPKVRAMELIDKFEKTKRCLYGGTVGYLGFDGNIDTCIAIRTVLFRNNKAYIQAGAGIVADSVPENEYNETKNKAMAMINAVTEAAGL